MASIRDPQEDIVPDVPAYPFDPAQQVGEYRKQNYPIMGTTGDVKPPDAAPPGVPSFVPDWMVMDAAQPAAPVGQPAAPAPQSLLGNLGPAQGAPQPSSPGQQPQGPSGAPGIGGYLGAIGEAEKAKADTVAHQKGQLGTLEPWQTTKTEFVQDPGMGPPRPVQVDMTKADYASRIASRLANAPGGQLSEADQIATARDQAQYNAMDELERNQEEQVVRQRAFEAEQTRNQIMEAANAKYNEEREAGLANKQEWVRKIAESKTGMSGADWAAFIGLSVLGVVGAAATGATNPGGGLFQAFVNKWAEDNVRKKEQQIELYRAGLTNARNDLLDIHDTFKNAGMAKEVYMEGIKAKLANDLSQVTSRHPQTQAAATKRMLELSQMTSEHSAKFHKYNEENAVYKRDAEVLKLDARNKKFQMDQAAQQGRGQEQGPARMSPQMMKSAADYMATDRQLSTLAGIPAKDRKYAMSRLGLLDDIKKAGVDIEDDASFKRYVDVRRMQNAAKMRGEQAGYGGAAPRDFTPASDDRPYGSQ